MPKQHQQLHPFLNATANVIKREFQPCSLVRKVQ